MAFKRRLLATLLLLVSLVVPCVALAQDYGADLHRLFAEYHEEQLQANPELATRLGRYDLNDQWRDFSPEARQRWRERKEWYLSRLVALKLETLKREDRVSARLLRYALERELEGDRLTGEAIFVVGQQFSWQRVVLSTLDRMPARNVKDYENIVTRLNKLPAFVDRLIAFVHTGVERGLVQPRLIVKLAVQQLDNQIAYSANDTPVLVAFRRFPPGISAAEQQRLRQSAVTAYEKGFLPAWRKARDYLATTYHARARDSTGINEVPNGKEIYAHYVRQDTTLNVTPAEIHRIGLREVERLENEMLKIAREAGFTGTLQQFESSLRADPERLFRSKEEMLAYCRNVAKIIEPELPRMFKNIPPFLYGIRAIPADREANTASNAQGPAPDGSRPGWFNLDTYKPETQVKYDKESLVLHEAVPGHILQAAIQEQLTGVPEFRKAYRNVAFVEGWALYVESLGSELGVYRDSHSRFGSLDSERLRAVRLVVDTGLHAFGWPRERAVTYFKLHAPNETIAEIDRYISRPAQALGYKMGQMKIRDLRDRAQQELGANFDLRDFHDMVLRSGSLPLELLEEEVMEYIRGAKHSPPKQ